MVLFAELAVLGFQQKHGNAGVVRFAEVVALVDRRLRRRCVTGNEGTGVFGGDVVERRQEHIGDRRDQNPKITIGIASTRSIFARRGRCTGSGSL